MKAVIFDMDGTLTDSEKFWTLTPLRLLEHYGVPEKRGLAAPWMAGSYRRSLKNYFALPDCRLHVSFEECDRWCKNYMYTQVYPRGVPLKPGARQTLEALRAQGVPMCLLSATERQALQYTLYARELLPYFDFWISTCGASVDKNHTRLFEDSARRLGARARECIVMEDSLYAMKTAKRAGCTVWAIEDDKHAGDRAEIRALADAYFTDHAQIQRALRGVRWER